MRKLPYYKTHYSTSITIHMHTELFSLLSAISCCAEMVVDYDSYYNYTYIWSSWHCIAAFSLQIRVVLIITL